MVQNADVCGDVSDLDVWWFRRDACWHLLSKNVHCSRTWSVAKYLYWFLARSGRTSFVKCVFDLEPGDVLLMDYGDNYIKHSMLVTGKTEDNLYLSYHDIDHLDAAFYGKGGILERCPTSNWWGFHVK